MNTTQYTLGFKSVSGTSVVNWTDMFVPPTIIANKSIRSVVIPPGLKAIGSSIPIVTWGGYSFYPFSYVVI